MKLILNGGGDGSQVKDSRMLLNSLIDHNKKVLYIPFAWLDSTYSGCLEFLTGELSDVDIQGIDMVRNTDELMSKNFSDYACIYIGGGNTYKLLNDLKTSGAFEKIKKYLLKEDGIVYGGSAGAIIFGKDLDSCYIDDANEVGLVDNTGFDMINGYSLLCHYTSREQERTELSKNYLIELSKTKPVYALPEEDSIFINDEEITFFGNNPYYEFKDGKVIERGIAKTIIDSNSSLFKDYESISKINVGFTNTIFNVDNKYIIKICTDFNNEEKFKKEISFYNSNKDNELIPKLYTSDTSKKDVPYIYEIIEKIDGVPLYDIWHTLNEEQRESIIKQLCDAMKKFHSNIGESYDWVKRTSDLFISLYNEAKELNIFSDSELELLLKAYDRFPTFLKSDEFVLVHNDLHFDNIFYKEGNINLIDFERSLYAPKDFELDILYRMIRKPWKFASEENEKYTKLSDYENIMTYIEKYYPELIHIDYLYERLAIYDMVYFLKQYINNPSIAELKEDILKAANLVANSNVNKESR